MLRFEGMEDPPLRLFLGNTANGMIHAEYDKRHAECDVFNELSIEAHDE